VTFQAPLKEEVTARLNRSVTEHPQDAFHPCGPGRD
jgi:hypothetical protein